jgi:hypothetical protein
LAGYFRDVVDFDPDPLATYTLDAGEVGANGFLLKLRQS